MSRTQCPLKCFLHCFIKIIKFTTTFKLDTEMKGGSTTLHTPTKCFYKGRGEGSGAGCLKVRVLHVFVETSTSRSSPGRVTGVLRG